MHHTVPWSISIFQSTNLTYHIEALPSPLQPPYFIGPQIGDQYFLFVQDDLVHMSVLLAMVFQR